MAKKQEKRPPTLASLAEEVRKELNGSMTEGKFRECLREKALAHATVRYENGVKIITLPPMIPDPVPRASINHPALDGKSAYVHLSPTSKF